MRIPANNLRGGFVRKNTDIHSYLESRIERIPESGCWIWMRALSQDGYGAARFFCKSMRAHRLAWHAFRGDPAGLQVLHHCDVPTCCNPAHLFLGTHDDNMGDKVAKRRQSFGENHGMTKLTEEQVVAIRADARTLQTIAAQYGVTFGLISHIKLRRLWKHIP